MRKWFWLILACVTLSILGGCDSPSEPVEEPVGAPAYVGHYASQTTEICYENGVCTLWSVSVDLFEGFTCDYKVAVTAQDPDSPSALIEPEGCTYEVYGHYVIMGGPATATFSDGTTETGNYYLDLWANEDWTTLQWYDITLNRS